MEISTAFVLPNYMKQLQPIRVKLDSHTLKILRHEKRLYEKAWADLELKPKERTCGFVYHTCYHYHHKFNVWLTEKDIFYQDHWKFELAKKLYVQGFKMVRRDADDELPDYPMLKSDPTAVRNKKEILYKTTAQELIDHKDVQVYLNEMAELKRRIKELKAEQKKKAKMA